MANKKQATVNRELYNTAVIDGNTYNINAVYSDKAGLAEVANRTERVNEKLTIHEHIPGDVATVEFDGSSAVNLDLVPALGGDFKGSITVPAAENVLAIDNNAVVNYGDIKDVVLTKFLNNSVLYAWDGANLEVTGRDGELQSISLITGNDDDVASFAQKNAVDKKFSAYIYIADNGNIYFGTSESSTTYSVQVSAETANQLTVARQFIVDLASNNKIPFNGSDDATLGVENVLSIANGGTNASNAKAAEYNINSSIDTDTGEVDDESLFVARHVDASTSNGAHFYKKASTLWSYIDSKIRATFGFKTINEVPNILPASNGGTGKSNLNEVTVGTANFATVAGNIRIGDGVSANAFPTGGKITISPEAPKDNDGRGNGEIWITY